MKTKWFWALPAILTMTPQMHASSLFFSSESNDAIYEIAPDGSINTFATGAECGALAFDYYGNLYARNAANGQVLKFNADGTSTLFGTGLTGDTTPGIGTHGFFESDSGTGSILYWDTSGTKSTTASGLSVNAIAVAIPELMVSVGANGVYDEAYDGFTGSEPFGVSSGSFSGTTIAATTTVDSNGDPETVAIIGNSTGTQIVEDFQVGASKVYNLVSPTNISLVQDVAVDSSLDIFAIAQNILAGSTDVDEVNPNGSVTVLAPGYSPTSLAVDQYSTFTIAAAPEPSTLLLIGGGLVALGLVRRRRRV